MNSQEYWEEIGELAEWISDNRPKELGGQGVAAEYGDGYDRHHALHETLDGHAFVIYTHEARQVVTHSRHPDSMMEQGLGSEDMASQDPSGFDTQRAYWAMHADIMDQAQDEAYDLDELMAERFHKIVRSDEFADEVRDLIEDETVPRWSSRILEDEIEIGGVEMTIQWMPNDNNVDRVVTVRDEEWNEARVKIAA